MPSQYINKQHILDRMRRFATDYMGISQIELLDPIVCLFLESLGEEIYKISGEIDNMETRILDKLSAMLISDINAITKPGHCILHATSQESCLPINTTTEFYYEYGSKGKKHSFFPVCNTTIYNGDVNYFIYKGLFYTVDKEQYKNLIARSDRREYFPDNSFWIGLELDENITNLKGLSFYIDFNTVYNKEEYLKQLSYTVWKIQETVVATQKGIHSVNDKYDNDTLELFSHYDSSNRINKIVKNKYNSNFFSIKDNIDISNKREIFPRKLESYFDSNLKNKFKNPLIWIEITCPGGFTSEIINSLQICINAFPVVNKKLISKTEEVKNTTPIIPLFTDKNEAFLSVHSLIDSTGKQYYDIPVNETSQSSYGTYSLRRGGCERYSIREAREYLINIINQLEGGASSFFRSKNDIKADLKKIQLDINQVIRNLNRIVTTTNNRYEIGNYILIEPDKESEIFFIEYWITTFNLPNNVKTGSALKAEFGTPVNPSSVIILSPVIKGEYAPEKKEKYQTYKNSLTKHQLLVTNEDIKDFCKKEFNEFIDDVHIRKGLVESPGKGFINTIDVYLKPHKNFQDHIGRENKIYFEQQLIKVSPATFNYRVFINNRI